MGESLPSPQERTSWSAISAPRASANWFPASGLARFIEALAGEIEADYLRWGEFEKSARHAIHSAAGVIELMPTSDGRLYSFKYVNGHPKNTAAGPAHGYRVRRARRRGDGLSAAALRDDVRHGAAHRGDVGAGRPPHGARREPRHGPDRQRRPKRIPGDRIPPHARHPRAAAVRYRSARPPPSSSSISRPHGCRVSRCFALRQHRARRCAARTSSPP